MARAILDDSHIHPAIRETIATHQNGIVQEVRTAVASNDLVVVGAHFSDRGRLFQSDRGRHFNAIVDARRCAQARGLM